MKTYRVKDMDGVEHIRNTTRHYTHVVFARLSEATLRAQLEGQYQRYRMMVDGTVETGPLGRAIAVDATDGLTESEYVAANMPSSLWYKPSFCGRLDIAVSKSQQWSMKKHWSLKTPVYDKFDIVELVQP